MAFIEVIDPEAAHGELARLYRQIASARGGVAAVHQAQSLNPRAMAAHLDIYKAIMFQPSSLSRAWREAIGVAVSRANACAYCVAHHQAALDQVAKPGESNAPPALLAWAEKLTRDPSAAVEADVQALRAIGLDDRAILDAILTVGYFNFVNRLVLATGTALEPDYALTCKPTIEPMTDPL